ncbi:hypothetical protein C8J56DRAFT_1023557 [Mycena floridula]|nr:hypothetical protein C8J56DRAFT_1023557 [Mycena floridula]
MAMKTPSSSSNSITADVVTDDDDAKHPNSSQWIAETPSDAYKGLSKLDIAPQPGHSGLKEVGILNSAGLVFALTFHAMNIASAIKEVIGLGLEIQKSIAKVGVNKKRISALSKSIAHDLIDLESLLHGYSFTHCQELSKALNHVKLEMISVLEQCKKLIPVVTNRTHWSVAKSQIVAWHRRGDIEEKLIQLEDRISQCLRRFTAYSTARIEHTSYRVENVLIGHIVENRVQSQRIGEILEAYFIETSAGTQTVRQLASIAFPVLVTRLLELINSSASRRGCNLIHTRNDMGFHGPHEAPDNYHLDPMILHPVARQEPEKVVFRILVMLKQYKEFGDGMLIQESARALGELASLLELLGSLHGETGKLRSWAIKLYRSLARRDSSFFPFLALHLSNSLLDELTTRREAYTICSTIHDTLPHFHSPALYLVVLNQYIPHLIHQNQFSKALPISEVAVNICRSLWVLPIAPINSWKKGQGPSTKVDYYFQTLDDICLAFSHLSICLAHTGHFDSSYTIARECVENFIQVPQYLDYYDTKYRAIVSRKSQLFITVSTHLHEADMLEDAYDAILESFKGPGLDDVHPQSLSPVLDVLQSMYHSNSLRFTHMENLIQVLHSVSVRLSHQALNIYSQLCLHCEKDIQYITNVGDWDNIAASHRRTAFADPRLSQPAAMAPQFWKYLSAEIDLVWACIYNNPRYQPGLISLSFSYDYSKSVDAMLEQVVSPQKLEGLDDVLQAMQKDSIDFKPWMVQKILNTCTTLLPAANTYDDGVMLNFCSILNVCGLHEEALDMTHQLIHKEMTTSVSLRAQEIRIEILQELNQYDEAVAAAQDLVAAWEQDLDDSFSIGYGAALDVLSSTLDLAGNSEAAAEVRAKADLFWG